MSKNVMMDYRGRTISSRRSHWLHTNRNREFPSFFKVMLMDFAKATMIPPAFSKHFMHHRSSKKYILQLSTCGVQKSWSVDVVSLDGRLYFRNRGWKSFLKDQNVSFGDFLVFNLVGDSTFQVVVYDKTCCSTNRKNNAVMGMELAKVRTGQEPGTSQYFEFERIFRQRSHSVVRFPSSFAKEIRIIEDTPAIVRDDDGRDWSVMICPRRWGDVELSRGWNLLAKAHNLKVGDLCAFRLLPGPGHVFEFRVIDGRSSLERDMIQHGVFCVAAPIEFGMVKVNRTSKS